MKQHLLPLLILSTAIALAACSTTSETPSPSSSPSPSSVPSPSPALETPWVKLTGNVALHGRVTHERVAVTIGELPRVTTCSDGTYTILGISQGEQIMRVYKASHLSAECRVTISDTGKTEPLPTVTLLGGDLTEDGAVNLFDLMKIGSLYAAKEPAASAGDLNADEELNLFDLVLVGRNCDQSGP